MLNQFATLSAVAALAVGLFCSSPAQAANPAGVGENPKTFALPAPRMKSDVSLEQSLKQRRSVRVYGSGPISMGQVSQLLWAAQGITDAKTGHRTAPSAMGIYPLTVYLFAAKVSDLPVGVYKYIPGGHKLEQVSDKNLISSVGKQPQMLNAPALLVYVANLNAFPKQFGDKADRNAAIEVGHSAQNVLLEEVSLGLVGVGMSGFDESSLKSALNLSDGYVPMYVVSVGRKS